MSLRALGACAWPWTIALAAAGLWLILPASAPAQTGSAGGGEVGLPSTTIAPAEGEAPEAPPPPAITHHRATPPPAHHVLANKAASVPVKSVPVEPVQARLLLKEDTWIYAQPSNRSAHLEQGEKGKFVMVSGTTHYFLRVKLKSGQEGYVLAEAVQLATPADKLFMLTHNAPVLDAPNRWGKKVSAVHQGHAVHVVGIALSYMKIRMKSGLEGYIPSSALE
ncbi:MAG TPA: hypothetical protein VNF28_03625 [Candidatus Binataceae bacterium]|nr:hypothetical protein [Candidatus Binataceae bacterium]